MAHAGADSDVYIVDNPGAADDKVFVVNGMVVDASAASAGDVVEWNGSKFVTAPTSGIIVPSEYLRKDGNLSGLSDAAAARTNLGLGSAATHAVGDFDSAGAAAAAQAASQPLDSDLTAIAALSTTSFGRAFLALADAAAGRTALGLGTAATQASTAFDSAGAAAAAQAASQPLDSDLTAVAALTTTAYGRALLTLADAAALRALTAVDQPYLGIRVGAGTSLSNNGLLATTGRMDIYEIPTPIKAWSISTAWFYIVTNSNMTNLCIAAYDVTSGIANASRICTTGSFAVPAGTGLKSQALLSTPVAIAAGTRIAVTIVADNTATGGVFGGVDGLFQAFCQPAGQAPLYGGANTSNNFPAPSNVPTLIAATSPGRTYGVWFT